MLLSRTAIRSFKVAWVMLIHKSQLKWHISDLSLFSSKALDVFMFLLTDLFEAIILNLKRSKMKNEKLNQ